MKIGIPLEGVLVDMDAHFDFWIARMGLDLDSRFSPKILRNESFWASPKPTNEIAEIGDIIRTLSEYDDFYIFTERPPALLPITRSWLKRHDVIVPSENLVMASKADLKRYDCRLLNIDYYVDVDADLINRFKYDYTIPVGIGNTEDFESWVQVHPTLKAALENLDPDLREAYIWLST